MTDPVLLRPVVEVAGRGTEIAAQLADELSLLSATLDVQHVGATSLGAGITRGDVDLAVRVSPSAFAEVVAALKLRFVTAQPQNWTPTYASFTDQRWDLPVGLQVCVVGSPDDFLVALRDLFLREPTLRDSYESVKRQAAGDGPDAYWRAKDAFLRELLTCRGLRPGVATARCWLVLVNGVPGAGKTTVARQLADHFRWPLISKDAFKELIFDGLGWSTKDWSLKVSATAHRLMNSVIEEQLGSGHSVVVESNFKPEIDSARFENLCSAFAAVPVQVLCWADPDVLFDRYWARQTSERHPGHVETATKEEQRRGIGTGRSDPLRISGPTIEVDTTIFDRIDYPRLFDTLSAITGQKRGQP